MLFHLLYPFYKEITFFNVFKYITFRSFVAFALATIISIVWGKYFIRYMKLKQFGQTIRDDGPESHFKKRGTPTLGGVFIIGSVIMSLLWTGNFLSNALLGAVFVMISYFILGWYDDYLKIIKKNSDGVSAKGKLLWQFVTSALVMVFFIKFEVISTELYLPFFKDKIIDLGNWYVLFGSFVIVGSSNAGNRAGYYKCCHVGLLSLSCGTF